MIKNNNRLPRLVFALALGMLAGCHSAAPKVVATIPPPSVPAVTAPVPIAPDEKPAPSKTPIKDRVEVFLADQRDAPHPLLPPGVRLLHADLADGVVTLDFSAEFNGLANMGDSVEGEAQKALCAVIAPIAGVEKLKVTVEGKPFDSEMADWSVPFSVHGATASTEGGGSRE